ncbi:ribonuclease E inhibitor RraB [Rhodoferax saidenbachensis]|nr:ribonuclease E inhibitor RraB [Rhodoferax saidenbachensis]
MRIAQITAILLISLHCMTVQAQSPVPREQLEQMFANITKQTKWDMSRPMLWGYFFTNKSRPPLEAAAKELSAQGYKVVNIYLSDKDKPNAPDLWWLHVERVEAHSVESLHSRNTELAAFAKRSRLGAYDGMDVGPVAAVNK